MNISNFLIVAAIIVVVFLFLGAVLLLRTMNFARPLEVEEAVDLPEVDAQQVAENLAAAIRCKTVSFNQSDAPETQAMLELHHLLEARFPQVHATLERRIIGGFSLLYSWAGRQAELEPAILMGHLDVVPVDPATLEEWEHAPFDGVIAGETVWGRGAMDDKGQVIAILQAVELLIQQGYHPQRTIYLAFGHDEEIGGNKGAKAIVDWMEENQIHAAAVLDEGGSIFKGMLPGVDVPVAMIGNSEKGSMVLEFNVDAPPGHSALPPKQTAIGILARSLAFLEHTPMPVHLQPIIPMFKDIGAALPFSNQFFFANLWLFGGLVRRRLANTPTTNASIRTTTAITVISGGVRENVLPARATARVNFRLLPGDRIATVCDHVRKALDDDRVKMEVWQGYASEASPVSPLDVSSYHLLARTIRQVFDNLPVAPYLMVAMTDSRHYYRIAEEVYRFAPYTLTPDDMRRVHGNNERLAVADLVKMVQFYTLIIQRWGIEFGE